LGLHLRTRSKELIELLLRRYGESVVYQPGGECRLRNGSRMVAMKSATDNAGAIIDELQLIYNKARQASITQNWPRSWVRRGGVRSWRAPAPLVGVR